MMVGKVDATAAITAAGLTAASSSVFGDYATIVVAAVFGGLVALSRIENPGWWRGVLFLFRAVTIAAGTTAIAARSLSSWTGYDVSELLVPVAGVIAFVGDDWFRVKDAAIARAQSLIGRIKE